MTLPVFLNRLCLECMRITGMASPLSARVLATMNTAMYDASTMYESFSRPHRLSVFMQRPEEEHTDANRRKAMAYAGYRVLHASFYLLLECMNESSILEDALDALEYEYKDFDLNPRTPEGLGNLAGQVLLDDSLGDGSNVWNTLGGDAPYADYTQYHPRIGPGEVPEDEKTAYWQPIYVPRPIPDPPFVQKFLYAHWGGLIPFALEYGSELRPHTGPEVYYAPRFKEQCAELIKLSEHLTDEHKAIVEFWNGVDEPITPAIHWCRIAAEVSKRDNHNAMQDVRLFFALSNALNDASIACWDAKRYFNYVRPVTAIRHLFAGIPIRAWGGPKYGGVRTINGEEWHPYQYQYFVSPPSPEYPSENSTLGAAAVHILEQFTTDDVYGGKTIVSAHSSRIERDIPNSDVELEWKFLLGCCKRIWHGRHVCRHTV